jgi:hypothetical protein
MQEVVSQVFFFQFQHLFLSVERVIFLATKSTGSRKDNSNMI